MNKYKKYAKNIYTQNGDDGIIEKLFEELNINDGVCVEFGAFDGVYISNIYNLWKNKNFHAVLIEGDKNKFIDLQKNTKKYKNVEIFNLFVDFNTNSENCLDNILAKSKFDINKDNYALLSIDIDSADYYVFKSIEKYYPKIIICETNTDFGFNEHQATYDSGCSIFSLDLLSKEKNYELVFHNGNAYFVRSDLYEKIKFEKTLEDLFCNTNMVQTYYQRLDEYGNLTDSYYYLSSKYTKMYKAELKILGE